MLTSTRLRTSAVAASLVVLAACDPNPPLIQTAAPTSAETTASYTALRELPAPKQPVPVAVYSYPDLTGQFKASETVSTQSRAVTQGAVWMLVKSLKDAAAGQWFKVIQRANLDNLLKERQIIRETRGRVEQQTGQNQPGLPSLLFAGVILEGGIIGYDSNTVTGGIGARYLGIGGDVQYRQDTVSVYLNAVSSQSGEVLKSVVTRKTVVSYGARGSVFKFVSFQRLLEGETGYTVNEPGHIALAQAIEHAVRSLIIEGALEGLWQFEDEIAGKDVTQAYLEDREDDLLIGDASSLVAQTLLNEDQLQKIADARQARRERLEEQELRRQERQLLAQRKKAEEDRARKLAAVQTTTPENVIGPVATPAQLAALKRRQQAERAGASAIVEKPDERSDKLAALAAAEAAAAREAAAAWRAVEAKEKAAAKKGVDPSKVLPTAAGDDGRQPMIGPQLPPPQLPVNEPSQKPAPLPIKQPGSPIVDERGKDADEANLLDRIPKLKPALGNGSTESVAASRLGLGGQTVKASDL